MIAGGQRRIDEPIEWSAATKVELSSRKCGLNTPQVLEQGFGHLECGVYGRIASIGLIKVGDEVALFP